MCLRPGGDACVLGVVERAGNALYGARVYVELGSRLAHAQAVRQSRPERALNSLHFLNGTSAEFLRGRHAIPHPPTHASRWLWVAHASEALGNQRRSPSFIFRVFHLKSHSDMSLLLRD
jgi:hypothetical protein